MSSPSRILAGLQAAVDGVLVAAVDGERRLEGLAGDFPDRFVVGVGVAVGDEQAVEELEQVARDAERAEGVDQAAVGDRWVDEVAERGLFAVDAASCGCGRWRGRRVLRRSIRATGSCSACRGGRVGRSRGLRVSM